MKVGFHGQESLSAVIERKGAEEAALGVAYWGYGGTLCHPTKSVQPFGRVCRKNRIPISVMMAVTQSRFISKASVAKELSEDGIVGDLFIQRQRSPLNAMPWFCEN